MSNKHAQLLDVVRRRQQSRWGGYRCIGDYHCGVYECDSVSPYSKSAHNVDSEVMILLQDWSSDDGLIGPILPERCQFGHDPQRWTNKRLRELLRRHFGLELEQVYATNVFPFVKLGPMNAHIPRRDLVRAAREFAVPQIEIIKPLIAVCLGIATFNAVAEASGHRRARTLADAIVSPFNIERTQVWCQAHTSHLGTNQRNRGGVNRTAQDWARMASTYDNLRNSK